MYPHFQRWAGPWEAECPRETLTQDWPQGAACFVPVYGEQREIKGIYNHPQKGKIQANSRLQGL